MSRYAYADMESFKDPLLVFPKGDALADPSRTDRQAPPVILMSRTDFTIKILDVPPLPDDQLRDMLSYRIRSLHPGDPARTVFDYQVLPWKGARYAVLFITRAAVRDSYRHLGDRTVLLLPFHLMKRRILECGRNEAFFLFWHRHWVDLFAIKDGKPHSSHVIKRTASLKQDTSRILKLLAPGAGEEKAAFTHFCAGEETAGITERFADACPAHDHECIPFEDLFRNAVARRESLFPKRKPIVLPPLKRRLALYGACAALLAAALFFRFVDHQRAYRDKLAAIESSLAAKSKDLAARLKETRALEREYAALMERKPVNLYRLLAELESVFPTDTTVRSILVKGNAFQLEGSGAQPLAVEKLLSRHPLFTDVKVSEMKPLPGTDRQVFRMKGSFANEKTH